MQVKVASRSETGPVRGNNEDRVAFWTSADPEDRRERGCLALIADGVGGSDGGEIAAEMATETALRIFQKAPRQTSLNALLWQMIHEANLAVFDRNRGLSDGGAQTTFTALIFRNDQVGIGHVGDCRTYHIHLREVKCLTTDHTYMAFHQRLGLFNTAETPEPLRGGLTRSIGKDPIVTIDMTYAQVSAGDYLVQLTDGIHAHLTEGEVAEIVTHSEPEEACGKLIALANSRGTQDNTTVQIIRIEEVCGVDFYRGIAVRRKATRMGQELGVGDRLDGRFDLLEVISRSGMASVFRARDLELNQDVAIKVPFLQFESDPAFFSRFHREEEIGRAMDHPSIMKIVAVEAEKKSRPYIAMELLRGHTLDEVMRDERPMRVSKAMTLMASICDALAHMHGREIVHRDLKPQNIMVCDDGTLRIMDFGIAKAAGMRRITFTGFSPSMGTPDYMAPEQVRGRRGDQRTDIYSVGAILYEMVTGQTPFEGSNPFLIMQARITGDPEAPTNFNRDITSQLEEIILHAMEREPRNRYFSAEEMAQELRNSDRVILTDRASRLQRPRVWKAHRRQILYYGFLALVPLILVGILYLVGHRQRPQASTQAAPSLPQRLARPR